MKMISVICTVVFVLSLLGLLVLRYFDGRMDESQAILPFFSADIGLLGIGFVAGLTLVYMAAASLMSRRNRKWTLAALAVVVGTTGVFWFCINPATVYLYGLRDRFVAEVGYPAMRHFAREIREDDSLTDADGMLHPPDHGAASPVKKKQWDDLVARYPFLAWNGGPATVSRHGSVEASWGSALTGHWGFEVALEGTLSVSEKDRGRVLRIADDLQFVCYYD